MANFSERIKIIIDVVTDGAKTGITGFKTAVSEAEGTANKFKAGATSAFDTVKANAGVLAAGAGAALVTFGVQAVGAFTDTAKSAIDLSTATGLSIEQASRWIAVGDDFEVSAEALQTGMGKIAKTMDSTKWAEYGIATRDAGGNARDTNDILLDSLDMLSNVKNATEQARIGQELFGKGYQSLTPILGHTRSEYEKMLGAVEKGQVITSSEAAKAEKFRLAQDNLADALNDVKLAVGGVVANLSPFIEDTASAVTEIANFGGAIGDVTGKVTIFKEGLDALSGTPLGWWETAKNVIHLTSTETDLAHTSFEDMQKAIDNSNLSVQAATEYTDAWYKAHGLLNPQIAETERETRKLGPAIDTAGHAANVFQTTVDSVNTQVQRDIDEMKGKWDELHGKITKEKALINYRLQVEEVKQAHLDVGTAIEEHGAGSPEHVAALENARLKELDLQGTTADLAQQYTDMPTEVVTDLTAHLDDASISKLPDEIDAAVQSKDYRVSAHLDRIVIDGETHAAGSTNVKVGGATVTINTPPGHDPGKASGGPVVAGQAYTVGERGSETFVPDVNGTIIPHGAVSSPVTIIQHFPPGISPTAVARANKEYHRRGGRAA